MNVIYRPQFWVDLERGVTYLAEEASPEVASQWHKEVLATVRRVENQPGLGKLRRDLAPPPHSHAFNWACLIGLFLAGGCSTIDTSNTSDRPWDRPTKADVSKDWWFDLGGQYWDSPGGHFP